MTDSTEPKIICRELSIDAARVAEMRRIVALIEADPTADQDAARRLREMIAGWEFLFARAKTTNAPGGRA
ncbi:MAG: hypothetical protein HYV09_40620 [Deltaproteobacteria bacterium]|nr:hypothetical protein [Deltaproteobacteria bacterium]